MPDRLRDCLHNRSHLLKVSAVQVPILVNFRLTVSMVQVDNLDTLYQFMVLRVSIYANQGLAHATLWLLETGSPFAGNRLRWNDF